MRSALVPSPILVQDPLARPGHTVTEVEGRLHSECADPPYRDVGCYAVIDGCELPAASLVLRKKYVGDVECLPLMAFFV
jgi:hypothetical protein